MSIKTVGMIGCGQMGLGIAQVMATAGLNVTLYDIDNAAIEKGLSSIRKSLEKLSSKDQLESTPDAILNHISSTTQLEDLSAADLVIEAIVENEAIKGELLEKLDQICKAECIFATNTSSISITRLAARTQRPENVIGMHFMNPVPLMQLVEVITSMNTSEETIKAIYSLIDQMGKVGVHSKDRPGFIVNRVLIPMINEAINIYDEGIASAEDIDVAMKLGTAQPIGPLALADLIGLDTCLSIMNVLYEGFKDSKYRPSPLLQQMVDSKLLGRKTGRGFFQYD